MNSGKNTSEENERKFHEFEAALKSLVDAGKYPDAIDFYNKNNSATYQVRGDSCTFYSFRIMGVCYLKDIQKVWNENGYRPSRWIAEGDRLFDSGNYPDAIKAYYNAVETDSDKAWYAMGCAYRAMGNPYESVEAWDNAMAIKKKDCNLEKLESDPNDASVWTERGNIDYNQENWGSAISSFNNSLALNADQPEIWFRRGCSYFENDKYQEALADFKKVLELQPDHFRAANDAAVALWKFGQYQQVTDYLDLAASHCPPGSIEFQSIQGNIKTASLKKRDGKILTFLC